MAVGEPALLTARGRERGRFRARLLAAMLLGLGGWLCAPAQAASIIERTEVQTSARGSILRFEFVAPIRYVNHAPLQRSAEVVINLRAISAADFDPAALRGRDTRGLDGEDASPFRGYEYDGGSSAGPRLIVRFERIVDYEIRTAPDLRTLVVVVEPPAAPAQPPPRGTPAAQAVSGYVIHLRSQTGPIDLARVPRQPEFSGLRLFQSQAKVKGRTWYRLNLGPFASRAAANRVLQAVRKTYPEAWISSRRQQLPPATAPASAPAPSTPASAASGEPSAQMLRLMDRALAAMTAGQFDLAIRLYTVVVERGGPAREREARELLGLAHERNGQLAHAKAEYTTYLERFPQGEDADRVRQRLAGVLTVGLTAAEREQITGARTASRSAVWYWNGSLSQYYFRNDRVAAELDQDESVLQSDLLTWFNLTGRRRGPRIDLRLQISASDDRDLRDGAENDDEIVANDLYVDMLDKRSGVSGRFGRQSLAGSGTQGRFDGLVAGYRLQASLRLNLLGGYPVDLNNKTEVQTDKPFVGLNAQFGPYVDRWNFSAYAIEQTVDELTDRQAVGGEARYFSPEQSYFLQLDHDLHFEELNSALLLANWMLPGESSLYLTLDQRLSPPLATSNALQGQPVSGIDELLELFSEIQIKQLARDRTAQVRTLSVGGTYRQSTDLQISADLTLSETGATLASGGLDATAATGVESFYTLQWLGDDFLFPLGTTLLTLRYSDTALNDTYAAGLDYRRALASQWRVIPRLELQYRDRNSSADYTARLSPLVSLEYRGWRRGEFEVAAGLDWQRSKIIGVDDETTEAVINLGYRVDF